MARIVTVYRMWHRPFRPVDMSYIRWLKISEGLARLGHRVDIATNEPRWFVRRSPLVMGPNLRRVPLARVRWDDYEVVKTLFDKGFEALEYYGGDKHPFIVSKLGSVVGPYDMEGIYFYGEHRKQLYALQERIHHRSRFVTVLSESARQLWAECFGTAERVLLVPGAAERIIPPPGRDPYPKDGKIRCLFAGTIYTQHCQPEANLTVIDKLNLLGKHLNAAGARLYMCGVGDVSRLDRLYVTYLGRIPYERTWDYFYHADVGVVVSAGSFMHNNESSKIYHYLRAGLPVVNESGFPNDYLVRDSRCGIIVQSGDISALAAAVVKAARTTWEKEYAKRYILENHTWDNRVEVYGQVFRRELSASGRRNLAASASEMSPGYY
jgi:glycosyltransferase involved in cell wall biosynthesis